MRACSPVATGEHDLLLLLHTDTDDMGQCAPKVVRERAKQLGVFDSIERPDPTPDWLKEDDEVPVLKEDDE